jgi:hypothetical protein
VQDSVVEEQERAVEKQEAAEKKAGPPHHEFP